MRPLFTGCLAAPLPCPTFLRCLLSLSIVKRTYHLPRKPLTPRSLSVAMHSKHRHLRSIARGTLLRISLRLKLRTPLLRPHPRHLWLPNVPLQFSLKSGMTLTWRCWARKIPSSSASCWHDQIQRLSCLLMDLGHCLRLLFLHYCTAYVQFVSDYLRLSHVPAFSLLAL